MAPRAIFPYFLSSRIFLLTYFLLFEGQKNKKNMYDDWKTVQAKWQSARETDKRKVLAFVVLGNKGGQESLNHPDIRQKFSSGSLTKSFDGLFFTKTLLPPKLKRIISSDHFQIADRLEKA